VEIHPTEQEKIFARYSSKRRLISRKYEETKKLNNEKTNNHIDKIES
jgi:hypothetical protein